MTARQTLLDGLARDADIFELVSELAPLHPRDNTFPGEVFLHLAADALDWCGASRSGPLALEGLREQFLPECTFRGRQNKKFQYAVLAAAALHGGTEPDLLDEVAWWQTDDFWQYGLFAAVGYIRAAASRAGVPVRQACQDLAGRPGQPSAITTSSGGCGSGHLTAGRPIITMNLAGAVASDPQAARLAFQARARRSLITCSHGVEGSAGMPPCVAKQVTRPVRNREASLAEPQLA